jgi:hypothetical protein
MGELFASLHKKKTLHVVVVAGIINIQQRMLSIVFEGYVVSKYGSYDVLGSGYKYIHYNLTDHLGYLTITLIVGSAFVTTFFHHFNVGLNIKIVNFGVTFKNKFEKGYWGLMSRVGTTTATEQIDAFPLCL